MYFFDVVFVFAPQHDPFSRALHGVGSVGSVPASVSRGAGRAGVGAATYSPPVDRCSAENSLLLLL